MGKFLVSDVAIELATKVVAEVQAPLTDEERRALFDRLHGVILKAFEEYETKANRLHQRVNP